MHLAHAGRASDLHHLLRLSWSPEATAQHNAWFEAKDRSGSLQEYIDDLAVGWRLAKQESIASVEQRTPAQTVGLEARYAIMTASTTSLAANLPGKFLVTLVQSGRWTPEQAVSYARRQPDPGVRSAALAALLDYVPGPAQRAAVIAEVLDTIPQVDFEYVLGNGETPDFPGTRAAVVQLLTPHLEGPQLDQALALTRAMRARNQRSRALAAIGAHLDDTAARVVFGEVFGSLDSSSSADTFEVLAKYLPAQLIPRAIKVARTIDHQYERTSALLAFLDRLSDAERVELLTEVQALTTALESEQRLELLAKASKYLPAEQVAGLVASAGKVSWDMQRVRILTMLLPHLSDANRKYALNKACEAAEAMDIESGPYKVEILSLVAPFLTQGERNGALRTALAALRITQANMRAAALSMLAAILPPDLLDEAITSGRAFESEYDSSLEIRALGALADQSPDVLSTADLHQILTSVQRMRSDENREYTLNALGPRLAEAFPKATRVEMAKIASTTENEASSRSSSASPVHRLVRRIAPRVGIRRRLQRWRSDANPEHLRVLAPMLAGPLALEAMATAKDAGDEFLRCRLLTQLLPYVGDSAKSQIAELVLATGPDVAWRFIEEVVPVIAETRILFHLAAARKLREPHIRAHVLLTLLPRLPDAEAGEVTGEILKAAGRDEPDRDTLSWVVKTLGPRLSPEQLAALLGQASQRKDPKQRFDLLAALIPLLGEGQVREALIAALGYALGLQDLSDRRDRIVFLIPKLLSTFSVPELYRMWDEALTGQAARSREQALADVAALAPLLASLGGSAAVAEMAMALRDIREWWP